MPEESNRQVVFVCQHGGFRSRMAAAYFNAVAPTGWSATSAGVTPQSLVSDRVRPMLEGTEAEQFIDESPPRAIDSQGRGSVTVAIDAEVPGAEVWRTSDEPRTDEEIRDEVRRRVEALVGSLRERSAV